MSKRIKTKSRLWTEEEFEILVDMMKQGTKLGVIADHLNRSYGSVQKKSNIWGKTYGIKVSGLNIYLTDHTIIGLMKSYVK
jgi:hypothetical protein